MKNGSHNPNAIIVVLISILIINIVIPPQNFKIADELSYVGWSFEILKSWGIQGFWYENNSYELLKLFKYPLGNSFLIAFWYFIFGQSFIGYFGITCWISAVLISFKTLKKLNLNIDSLILYASYLPLLLIMRSYMSENASILLSSIYVFVFFSINDHIKKFAFLGFISGISIWFRETNIFLYFLPVMYLFLLKFELKMKAPIVFFLALIIGILPRLISSQLYYGDLFYVKDPGYGFSLFNIPNNLIFLILACFYIVIGAIYSNVSFKQINIKKEEYGIIAGMFTYVLIYLLYGYDSTQSSGFKSIILQGRFYIPILPFIIILLSRQNLRTLQHA